jgi:hypothetical protein
MIVDLVELRDRQPRSTATALRQLVVEVVERRAPR